ncbi:MAG TPA: type II toxin-antitoxin system PemK/MazF family toxin [Rhodanobacteraceae bacterium]
MALLHHPNIGDVLVCNFPYCLVAPEMIKARPVVVVSRQLPGRPWLCTIVPLSTTAPHPVQPYHCEVATPGIPAPFDSATKWAKADMVYTFSLERLARFRCPGRDADNKRRYVTGRVSMDDLAKIKECVKRALSLT